MFADTVSIAARHQLVDLLTHGLDRLVQPLLLGLGILGHQLLHHDARFMQNNMTEPDAFAERRAGQGHRFLQAEALAGLGEGLQLARGDHFGQQHGRGLQRLDFLFRIGPAGAVLHDKDAERIAATQYRDAKEGLIDFLAGFRAIGKGGVGLGVGQCQRLRLFRDQADQTFAGGQGREMDRFAIQALGGVELQLAVGAQDIDGANLGHHIGGDMDDDPVQSRLCAHRLRHDFAKPAQKQTGSAQSAAHIPILSGRANGAPTHPKLTIYSPNPACARIGMQAPVRKRDLGKQP